MARGSLSIRGTKELQGRLRRNARLTDVKKAVLVNGSELQRNMQRDSPVDTGNLKRSIGMNVEDRGFTARVGAAAEYAPYLVYGTRFMYSRDFFRPNFYTQRQKFLRDLKRLMK